MMHSSSGSGDDSQALLEVSNGTFNTGFTFRHTTILIGLARDASLNRSLSDIDRRDSVFRNYQLEVTGGNVEMFVNGSSVDVTTYTPSNPNTLNELRVGEDNLLNRLIGDVAELIFVEPSLSASQDAALHSYLSDKWGL
jgi:hypothetical protein